MKRAQVQGKAGGRGLDTTKMSSTLAVFGILSQALTRQTQRTEREAGMVGETRQYCKRASSAGVSGRTVGGQIEFARPLAMQACSSSQASRVREWWSGGGRAVPSARQSETEMVRELRG
jgi:hypothetical protein